MPASMRPDVWDCPRCHTSYLASAKEPRFPRRAWGLVCSSCRDETGGIFRWAASAAVVITITYFALKGAA